MMARSAEKRGASPRTRRFRGRHGRQVESRAKALEDKLKRILADQVEDLVDEAVRGLGKRTLVKKRLSKTEQRMLTLLTHYGLMQIRDGGRGIAEGKFLITPQFERGFLAQNKILVQELSSNVRQAFRDGMQRAFVEWRSEDPKPGVREIARRLRMGQLTDSDKWSDNDKRFLKPLSTSTSIHGLASRARTIARTEIGRARNAGRVEGMRLAGFTHHKWSSYSDIHSRRGHAKMNGQIRLIGEPFDNPETGEELEFPGDPSAKPSETINCRCTVVPTIVKS